MCLQSPATKSKRKTTTAASVSSSEMKRDGSVGGRKKGEKRTKRVGEANATIQAAVGVTEAAAKETPTTTTASHLPKNFVFPPERTTHLSLSADYSELETFRHLMNTWHTAGYITYPPFALELCTLFMRCLNTVGVSDEDTVGVSDEDGQKSMQYKVVRGHLKNLIAALGWIYAFGYKTPLPNGGSKMQSLEGLYYNDTPKFHVAMEVVQLLLAAASKQYKILPEDVFTPRLGKWFNNNITQVKKGIWSNQIREENRNHGIGMYLPLYLAFRAIHPACPQVTDAASVHVSVADMMAVWLEPRLYMAEGDGDCGEVKIFPKSLPDGTNYTLWYFYDTMQPNPFG
jgi:hypothetical protein